MNVFSRILAVFLCVISVLTASGCKDGYKDAYIYFELSEKPNTLDAQTASSDSELLIVRNIYEGLLRKNENGKIVCGVAENYTKNGLVYTFNLKDNLNWSNGDKLTADDFVFALRRAVSPKTKSPFVKRLFCIKNAQEISDGKADISTLGVTADDEHTLTITLCYDDSNFENTLTTSICMPCNEQFFKSCIGKYGLKSEYTISNGSYSITKWNKEDFGIRLYKNKEYCGDFDALNSAVFLSCREDENTVDLLGDNHTDMAFIKNSDMKNIKEYGLSSVSYQNICWVMTVSKEYPIDVRRALLMAVSPDIYGNSFIDGFSVARSVFPKTLNTNVADGVGIPQYDLNSAQNIMSAAVLKMEDKKFPASTLYYFENDGIKAIVTSIAAHWQKNLSAFVNIQSVSGEQDLTNQIANPTLDFAVFPIKVNNTSLTEYLSQIGISGGDAVTAQSQLLKNHTLLPIAFENTNIVYTGAIKQMYSEPENGYIDFSFVIKKE